jgi:hypothetical protein
MGFLKQWWRVGGACGILFLVLFIVGSSLQGAPPTRTDPVSEIRSFWVEDGESYLTGDYIIGLGFMLFFIPFVSGLSSLLGRAEGDPRMWSRIVLVGGILFLGLAAGSGAFWTALAFGDVAENASDDTIILLMDLSTGADHFIPAGLAIMVLPAALVMLQTRVLPLWLGVLTLIEAVLAILAPLAILADDPNDSVLGFLPFLGSGIWILVTSIVMVLKKDAPPAGAVA